MKKVTVKLDKYKTVSEAVYSGIVLGLARAHKYEKHPSPTAMADAIDHAVMLALCEVIDFDK